MPRYFFDFHDDGHDLKDEVGVEADSLEQLRGRARLTLRDAIADATQQRNSGEITIVVRDQQQRAILRAEATWKVSRPHDG